MLCRLLRGLFGHGKRQRVRNDPKIGGKPPSRLAVHLYPHRFGIYRLAAHFRGPQETDMPGAPESSGQEQRYVGEIFPPAARRAEHQLKVISVKIGTGSDLDRTTVMLGSAGNDERCFCASSGKLYSESRKPICAQLPESLEQNAIVPIRFFRLCFTARTSAPSGPAPASDRK